MTPVSHLRPFLESRRSSRNNFHINISCPDSRTTPAAASEAVSEATSRDIILFRKLLWSHLISLQYASQRSKLYGAVVGQSGPSHESISFPFLSFIVSSRRAVNSVLFNCTCHHHFAVSKEEDESRNRTSTILKWFTISFYYSSRAF